MNRLSWRKTACTLVVICAATARVSPAQTYKALVSFNVSGGNSPVDAGLVQGPDGNLYGTTFYGGNGNCSFGCGTVFKMTPRGALTTLHTFQGSDGASPASGLVLGLDGNFYGTTNNDGGGAYCLSGNACGTIFKMTPGGTLTTLYSFCSLANCADGYGPRPLIQASNGYLYGTTAYGGNSDLLGCGTIFQINPAGSGTLTTLFTFPGEPGGCEPFGLVLAANGNFYGTTDFGGHGNYGTAFTFMPQGTVTTLYSFCSQSDCADGSFPAGGLVQASDGNFYGVTSYGGNSVACSGGCGTVFKITATGTFSSLHSFAATDGFDPDAGLIQATDGNLYGTTVEGGYDYMCPGGCGTIFEITPGGTFTNLYALTIWDAGADLQSPLVQDTNGIFYGNTRGGGLEGSGVVFTLMTGLGPFVEMLPNLGAVGARVTILGTNLTGTTSVTFNGTAATFTVNPTGTAINTTVPSGATTGTVQVVTPGGTLSSNVPFRVRH